MSEGAGLRRLTTEEGRQAPEQVEIMAGSRPRETGWRRRAAEPRPRKKSLVRPRDNRWIAGVCSGLAYRFGLPPFLVRVLFILSCLLPGPQVLVYIILWIIMPAE
jgi:phage shock protein PspC (stress-responsive transcriptional regulator)